MSESKKSVFEVLSRVPIPEDKIKKKGKLDYLSWSFAWEEVKKLYPDASFKVYPQTIDAYGNTRPWHDDGKSGWVEVGVTIDGVEIVETLAIMNMNNTAMKIDQIDSVAANKAIKRCMVKAIALFGLGLYLYQGEDLPDAVVRVEELQMRCADLLKTKCKQSERAKQAAQKAYITAFRKANPDSELPDDQISGHPALINDVEALEYLKTELLSIRK